MRYPIMLIFEDHRASPTSSRNRGVLLKEVGLLRPAPPDGVLDIDIVPPVRKTIEDSAQLAAPVMDKILGLYE